MPLKPVLRGKKLQKPYLLPQRSGQEALRALLVAEACELSRRERRPVALAEIERRAGEFAAAS